MAKGKRRKKWEKNAWAERASQSAEAKFPQKKEGDEEEYLKKLESYLKKNVVVSEDASKALKSVGLSAREVQKNMDTFASMHRKFQEDARRYYPSAPTGKVSFDGHYSAAMWIEENGNKVDLSSWLAEPDKLRKKKITDVHASREAVHTPYFKDPARMVSGPGPLVLTDQDGSSLHPDLAEKIENALAHQNPAHSTADKVQEILDDWNSEAFAHIPVAGHFDGCPYPRDPGGWACTCQPPTLWGKVKLYLCACCEQPVARELDGLCDRCEGHQYALEHIVEMDHASA